MEKTNFVSGGICPQFRGNALTHRNGFPTTWRAGSSAAPTGSGPHSNAVTATPAGTQLGLDFNGDGKVNFSDLLILAQNYGKGGTQATDSLSKLVDAVRTKRRR